MLLLLKKIAWGRDDRRSIKDMNSREIIYLVPLVVFVLWVGLFPKPFVNTITKTLQHLIAEMQRFM